MTSFSTAGGGVKAATFLPAGRVAINNGYQIADATSSLKYTYTGGSGTVNAVSITGSGAFTFGMMYKTYFGGSGNNAVEVLIDGVSVYTDSYAGDMQNIGMIAVGSLQYYPGQIGLALFSLSHVAFNKSLVVQMSSDDNTFYAYNYYLT
tara:strand:- start:3415 stop:3861 length:447 start_codon:yes stop_codon:yes gene_type:complete